MRRIGLIVLLLAFAIAAGFASVRLQRPAGVSVPAHTITYRLISYDNNGNVTRTSVVIRKVLSDGTWNHTTNQSGWSGSFVEWKNETSGYLKVG